ncbi:MAG: hypothetical protein ABIM50_10860, partial [Novosphingobium sp.]
MTPTRLEPAPPATPASASEPANAATVKPLQLAVILPTYNERANLRPLVARLDAALSGNGG